MCNGNVQCKCAVHMCNGNVQCKMCNGSMQLQVQMCSANVQCKCVQTPAKVYICKCAVQMCNGKLQLQFSTAHFHCTFPLHISIAHFHCTFPLHISTAHFHCTFALHICTAHFGSVCSVSMDAEYLAMGGTRCLICKMHGHDRSSKTGPCKNQTDLGPNTVLLSPVPS